MKKFQLFKCMRKDTIGDILKNAMASIDKENIKYHPICGFEEYEEIVSISEAIKKAKCIDIDIKEPRRFI